MLFEDLDPEILYKDLPDYNKKNRYTRLLMGDALLQLLSSTDYNDISVKDICNKAGVSRTAYYHHYKSKHDIIDTLCKMTGNYVEFMLSDEKFKNDPQLFYFTIFSYLYHNRHIFEPFCKSDSVCRMIMSSNQIAESFAEGESNRDRYKRLSQEVTLKVIIIDWLKNGATPSPREMSIIASELIDLNV